MNERKSPYGAGWSVAGLQRIHLQEDGLLVLAGGDGSAAFFALGACDAEGCGYARPAGDFSELRKRVEHDGSGAVVAEEYRRRFPDGRLASIRDPGGRSTRVAIDTAGNLVRITDPDGVPALRAHYRGVRLVQQWDRSGSGWGFTYDAAGKLAVSSAPGVTTAEGAHIRPTTRFRSWEAMLLPPPG